MGGGVYCLLAGALSLAVLAFIAYLPFSGPRTQIFKDWREVLEAWRLAASPLEKLIVALLIARYLKGPVLLAFMVPFIGVVGTIGTAICGLDVEVLRVARAMLEDLLAYLRER